MVSMMEVFKAMLIVQLFYSFAITMMATAIYGLPVDVTEQVQPFRDLEQRIDMESVSNDIQDSITRQLDIPVVELGALVFYSGNIILDLFLNFIFAVPEMITLFIYGFTYIFSVDNIIVAQVQVFLSILMMILYFIGLIQLLLNIRSRSAVI